MARIHWHPAFVQAMAIELADYQDVLTFESEHQLMTEPLKIDVLIIKKEKDVVIKKNIGQIFRKYNVVEYKSPTDRATIADYNKTQCYSRLYAALNNEDTETMSVTIVATRFPRKLMRFLERRYSIYKMQLGIYYVFGDTSPTQIIVSEELPEADNLWLNSLRNDLTAAQLVTIDEAPKPMLPMDAYVYVLGEANIESMEEMIMQKKKGYILSEKLDAYFYERVGVPAEARGRAAGKAAGIAEGIAEGIVKGETQGQIKTLLNVLRARFKKVPKETDETIRAMTDSIALDSWAVHAATCSSMKEFEEALKR